jgi:hypothetical protein
MVCVSKRGFGRRQSLGSRTRGNLDPAKLDKRGGGHLQGSLEVLKLRHHPQRPPLIRDHGLRDGLATQAAGQAPFAAEGHRPALRPLGILRGGCKTKRESSWSTTRWLVYTRPDLAEDWGPEWVKAGC